jgi:hypothetical protein
VDVLLQPEVDQFTAVPCVRDEDTGNISLSFLPPVKRILVCQVP